MTKTHIHRWMMIMKRWLCWSEDNKDKTLILMVHQLIQLAEFQLNFMDPFRMRLARVMRRLMQISKHIIQLNNPYMI